MPRRPNLGLTEPIMFKVHPDIKAWLEAKADADYCGVAEVIRHLILDAMRAEQRES